MKRTKHLKPPGPSARSAQAQDSPSAHTRRKRRAAFRFGFSAVIASIVVLAMLIFGAMFQEEYEEGFVRIVSFAVRLASPDEVAQAEAQGQIPDPLPSIRPDTPVVVLSPETLTEAGQGQIILTAPETLIPIDDFIIETPETPNLPPRPTDPENEPTAEEPPNTK